MRHPKDFPARRFATKLINPDLAMNYKMTPVESLDRMRAIWESVVGQIVQQGLALGEYLDSRAQLTEGGSFDTGSRTRR